VRVCVCLWREQGASSVRGTGMQLRRTASHSAALGLHACLVRRPPPTTTTQGATGPPAQQPGHPATHTDHSLGRWASGCGKPPWGGSRQPQPSWCTCGSGEESSAVHEVHLGCACGSPTAPWGVPLAVLAAAAPLHPQGQSSGSMRNAHAMQQLTWATAAAASPRPQCGCAWRGSQRCRPRPGSTWQGRWGGPWPAPGGRRVFQKESGEAAHPGGTWRAF